MNTDALLRKIASKKNMPVIDLLLAILDRLTNTMMNGKKGNNVTGNMPDNNKCSKGFYTDC
jgi:hypothetical protein